MTIGGAMKELILIRNYPTFPAELITKMDAVMECFEDEWGVRRNVPLSVINQAREKIDERYDIVKRDDIRYAEGLAEAIDIIDEYVSAKNDGSND